MQIIMLSQESKMFAHIKGSDPLNVQSVITASSCVTLCPLHVYVLVLSIIQKWITTIQSLSNEYCLLNIINGDRKHYRILQNPKVTISTFSI